MQPRQVVPGLRTVRLDQANVGVSSPTYHTPITIAHATWSPRSKKYRITNLPPVLFESHPRSVRSAHGETPREIAGVVQIAHKAD